MAMRFFLPNSPLPLPQTSGFMKKIDTKVKFKKNKIFLYVFMWIIPKQRITQLAEQKKTHLIWLCFTMNTGERQKEEENH